MYKVLYLIDTLAVGGAERSLLDITSRFESVQPVMCHLYTGDALKPTFETAGVRVTSLNINKKYGFGEAVRRLTGGLKTVKSENAYR